MGTPDLIPLGTTNIQISPVGVGTWAWGDRIFWQYGRGGFTDADIQAAFETSLEKGLNLFDTAEIYGSGRSERLLGQFLQHTSRPVVVATKFFPYPWRFTKGALRRALQKSLCRLGLEQVDLYQTHWPYPPRAVEIWVDEMANAVETGRTRAVGVSNYDRKQTRSAYTLLKNRGVPLASNQVRYSLLARKVEFNGLLTLCRELKITLIAYRPLAMGALTGKYTSKNPPPGIRGRSYRPEYLA